MAYKRSPSFIETEAAGIVKKTLQKMHKDPAFNTDASYAANVDLYPDHRISFVDKHMNYLQSHPTVDPDHYLANLRLVTKIR